MEMCWLLVTVAEDCGPTALTDRGRKDASSAAAAVLELLAGAAGAGVVAADAGRGCRRLGEMRAGEHGSDLLDAPVAIAEPDSSEMAPLECGPQELEQSGVPARRVQLTHFASR